MHRRENFPFLKKYIKYISLILDSQLSYLKYLIGIDEAWRGAWAWPVVAGAFCAGLNFDFSCFPGLTDSKKISYKNRERLYSLIEASSLRWECFFASGSIDAEVIDRVGIREANKLAMQEALYQVLEKVPIADISQILIDGRDNYIFEGIDATRVRYIVWGDLTEKSISAASIVAKVTRDRKMCDFSVEYWDFHFDLHKGYGTRKHQQALMIYAISPIHRKSYAPIKRLISDDS